MMLNFLIGLLILIVVGVVGYGIYYLVETVNQPELTATGVISDKTFTPQHTILVYNASLKTSLPQVIPDSWNMNVTINDLEELDGMTVSHEMYDSVQLNTPVMATYRVGRISNDKYLFGIKKL